MGKIRLIIVEDHLIVSKGIEMILENDPDLQVTGSVSEIEAAYDLVREHKPDVVLLDLDLGRTSGLDHIQGLRESGARNVLVVTGSSDSEALKRAIENGASGTVLKHEAGPTLIKAIKKVNEGEFWIDRHLTAKVLNETFRPESETFEDRMIRKQVRSLTPREMEIVELISQGLTNKEAAAKLHLSEKTVRNGLTVIFSKLGVATRLELVIKAAKLGIVNSMAA